jgi:hypothetical protein
VKSPTISQRRDTRALIFGAVTIGFLILLGKGLPFARYVVITRSDAAMQSIRQRQTEQRLAAVAPAVLAAALEAEEELIRVERRLVPGTTPAEAAASLALLIDRYAVDANVAVSSTNARADTLFVSPHPRITVRAFATADVAGLMSLLAMIEGSEFFLGVAELTVTQPEPAAKDDVPESLRLELVVEALARRGTALIGAP